VGIATPPLCHQLAALYSPQVRTDVAILGAGPGGSAAAILLARAGYRVALVEQHRFPREKVCGECLSATGVEVIGRLGLRGAILSRGAVRLRRAILHPPAGEPVELPLPRAMWGVSRATLDGALLDAARTAGGEVLQPARAEAVAAAGVVVRDMATNVTRELPARVVVVADGKSALLGNAPAATGDLGIKTHYVDVDGPADAIELFGVDGHYGGLAAIEGGRWNAAFSVPAARVKAYGGDLDALFGDVVRDNACLARRLRHARRVLPWLAAPLPRFGVRKQWPRNVVPVGNAAAALEPIGGEGMGLALRSAELAAEAIDRALRAGGAVDTGRLRAAYQALWRTRRAACRAAAVAVSRPAVAEAGLALVEASPLLGRVALAAMGKA